MFNQKMCVSNSLTLSIEKMPTTIEILEEIVQKNPQIESLKFSYFPKQTLLQEHIQFGIVEEMQFREAMMIRNTYNLPFWDSMMLTYFNRDNISDDILNRTQNHNSPIEEVYTRDLSIIEQQIEVTSHNLSINSFVKMKDGSKKHIPLLDFHIPQNPNNEKVVRKALKVLDLTSGYIMESGDSYHYIGDKLIEDELLMNFLSRALLLSPIIDRVWIAHQIIERSCSLRVSYKHGITPKLIFRIT